MLRHLGKDNRELKRKAIAISNALQDEQARAVRHIRHVYGNKWFRPSVDDNLSDDSLYLLLTKGILETVVVSFGRGPETHFRLRE